MDLRRIAGNERQFPRIRPRHFLIFLTGSRSVLVNNYENTPFELPSMRNFCYFVLPSLSISESSIGRVVPW